MQYQGMMLPFQRMAVQHNLLLPLHLFLYRYFPDPDLPPIHISDAWIEKIKAEQPELREVKQARYQEEYGLPAYDAGILTESRHLAGLFEETAAIYGNAKKTANWFMGEILRLTKD